MPANDERSGFRRWLDRRTGLDSLLDHALDEPIPGGAKIAYVFGSGLLFLFLSQIVTGVFLAMYYVPSADHAHTTVAYITKEVTGGSILPSSPCTCIHLGRQALLGRSLKILSAPNFPRNRFIPNSS